MAAERAILDLAPRCFYCLPGGQHGDSVSMVGLEITVSQSKIAYAKTKLGQLLYDLAFTELSDSYLARKHKLPIDSIRRMRDSADMKALRRKIAADRTGSV